VTPAGQLIDHFRAHGLEGHTAAALHLRGARNERRNASDRRGFFFTSSDLVVRGTCGECADAAIAEGSTAGAPNRNQQPAAMSSKETPNNG
jgi:hypothetical protein